MKLADAVSAVGVELAYAGDDIEIDDCDVEEQCPCIHGDIRKISGFYTARLNGLFLEKYERDVAEVGPTLRRYDHAYLMHADSDYPPDHQSLYEMGKLRDAIALFAQKPRLGSVRVVIPHMQKDVQIWYDFDADELKIDSEGHDRHHFLWVPKEKKIVLPHHASGEYLLPAA